MISIYLYRSMEPVPCVNRAIQGRFSKKVEVKQSEYGFGAYLCEDAEENDLIAEYTGEVIYEGTGSSRSAIYSHLNRNYLFDTFGDSRKVIDAFFRGNVARFINHADGQHANTFALASLVNGTPRLGIYAGRYIPATTELTLDYGAFFPLNHHSDTMSSDE
ncbi:hypothetical protein ONZ45_g18227 [Pleurotus djamor]|nr:hypothetical protein ONZ45_g18227 [Pleurotus djamor]